MAGQQADLRTMLALGTHPCSLLTAITAQNNEAVAAVQPLTKEQIQAQFDSLTEAMPADAIKLGLLPTATVVETVAKNLAGYTGPIICDPVLAASAGQPLMDEGARAALLNDLLPLVTLVTPNLPETAELTGLPVTDADQVVTAAAQLLNRGARAVLIKGGHSEGPFSHDYFASAEQRFWISNTRQHNVLARGTGCTFASAVAAVMAQGYPLHDAVIVARMAVTQALRNAYQLGAPKPRSEGYSQVGPALVRQWPQAPSDLPFTSDRAEQEPLPGFPSCGPEPLGLYPVVDSSEWIERLLDAGVTTIQLRIKDPDQANLEQEIAHSIELAKQRNARLFINDYWQLAIKHQAYGVHLGQSDLDSADIVAIREAGLRLGISTHSYFEAARAWRFRPSYVALGPIYPTTSKVMPWRPQGLTELTRWVSMFAVPVVAIGGIGLTQFEQVADTGVDGIAMISALTAADDPESVVSSMQQILRSSQALS